MMRCLRDMNMSKFVAEDVPLFLSLIDDLFPALKADRASFPDISAALEKVCFYHPVHSSMSSCKLAASMNCKLSYVLQHDAVEACTHIQHCIGQSNIRSPRAMYVAAARCCC